MTQFTEKPLHYLFFGQMLFNLFTNRYDLLFFEISSVVVVYVTLLIAFLYSKLILKVAENGSEKK